jgi:low temperature requirement protein LtrA
MTSTSATRLRLEPMRPRNPDEVGRTATPLELFFDLVFVIAVSMAAVELHHALTEAHVTDGLVAYGVVFFGIWWAWMSFTWFATSFGTDDWLYRVLTFVQMGGVLVLAAGIEPAFVDHDYTLLVFAYVLMRAAMIAQWFRASRSGGAEGRAARIYAAGIAGVQVLWLLFLLLSGPIATIALLALIAAELAVPVVAEQRGTTPRHPHHITERYGLFTIIVLGEGLLAATNATLEAVHGDESLLLLVGIAVLGVVVTAALFWIYFWPPQHEAITSLARSLQWGYVHYFVFAAAAAFSAGVEVQIDIATGQSKLGEVAAGYSVAIPVAVFVLGIWWIALRDHGDRAVNTAVPGAAALVLVSPLLPTPILMTAIILVAVVVVLVLHPPRTKQPGGPSRPRARRLRSA